ncbi:NUDIX domain-containing protein [Olleya aquimaris]|uniref:NUDIX domain-containing protein n=1 Tax=Olleya sediminilitoris TaxID=2795739 RepID=A0ABS1WLQ9_9FLAO|nr:NUDIX domain-containing protein [Olleya sediminilitoris]AXO80170.1 NUDIX domain-containing protein [Olleya aquimaris]MBL7560066.1 NUDIX domain-containing protein [Olleya sediminilitoris]
MQCIFVNDKPIYLTTTVEKETDFKNFLLKDVNIDLVLQTISKKSINSVRLIGHDKDKLMKAFKKKLPNVIAGGGKVLNNKGDILFIYRNDKWDLPKGKAEKKETIEETAIREVAEETGVDGLKIVKPLPVTYHVFKRNGKSKLKITHWFEMYSDFEDELQPQINEGITKVEWLNEKAAKQALSNSYANIKLLF